MSRARVRDTSAGDNGRALLRGSRACSSRSLIAGLGGACTRCCCQPKDRSREPSTDDGATAAAPKEKTTSATVTKMITASTVAILSNLNADNLLDHEIPNGLKRNSGHHQGMPDRIIK